MGSDRALEKLIAQAKINPEIKEMAERLGFKLPFDIFAEGEIIKRAAGITRDVKGSVADVVFEREIKDAIIQADNVIADLGGSSDLSLIANNINKSLNDLQIDLETKASKLYAQVDDSVKRPQNVDLQSTMALLNQIIQEDGIESLSPKLRAILKRKGFTYGGLVQLKGDIGQAIKGSGPFKDSSSGQLKRIYGAITDDQLANVNRLGGDDVKNILVKANELTAKKKALEDNIISAMGKDLEGSLASSLRTSISTASKGEVAKLNRTLELIPEELRREAIITAISTLSRQGGTKGAKFGFAQYGKIFSGLENQSVVMNILKKNLGNETVKVLSELNIISNRITEARGNVSATGKANQALINSMQAEGILEKFLGGSMLARAAKGAVGGTAGFVSGVPYAAPITATLFQMIKVSPKERLKMAGDLFNDTRFRTLIDNISETGTASVKAVNDLANSPVYRRWAKTMGIEDPRNWLNTAIVGTADTDAIPVEPEGIPTETEELTQSSALQSIIERTDSETRDRILQQV
jgi:hypothetical protein